MLARQVVLEWWRVAAERGMQVVLTPAMYDRCSKGRLMEVLGDCN